MLIMKRRIIHNGLSESKEKGDDWVEHVALFGVNSAVPGSVHVVSSRVAEL